MSDWTAVLGMVAIDEGTFSPDPEPKVVPRGEVKAFPPPGPRSYRASEAEVALARKYAACGAQVDFAEAVDEMVARSAQTVSANHRSDAQEVYDSLVRIDREASALRKGMEWDGSVSLESLGLESSS